MVSQGRHRILIFLIVAHFFVGVVSIIEIIVVAVIDVPTKIIQTVGFPQWDTSTDSPWVPQSAEQTTNYNGIPLVVVTKFEMHVFRKLCVLL